MDAVPLEAYEASPDAYLLTDSRGRVRMLNEAAGRLFECDPEEAVGRRCWGIVGLHAPDGAPLCRAQCRVRAALGNGEPCYRQRAVRPSRSGAARRLDVHSLKVESRGRSWGVLHMFSPVGQERRRPRLPVVPAEGSEGLQALTRREKEVLRALAAGQTTESIADDFFISTATVRNHVRAILRKLRVKKRLDAVLIWVSQFR